LSKCRTAPLVALATAVTALLVGAQFRDYRPPFKVHTDSCRLHPSTKALSQMPKTLPTSLPEVSIYSLDLSPLSFLFHPPSSIQHPYPLFNTPRQLRQTASLASHPPYTPTRFPSQLQTRPIAAQLSEPLTTRHANISYTTNPAIPRHCPAQPARPSAAAEASLLRDCARALLAAHQATKTNPIDLSLSSETR
jgi:hypothetical protein